LREKVALKSLLSDVFSRLSNKYLKTIFKQTDYKNMNNNLILEKRINKGFLLHAIPESAEILNIKVHRFDKLHIHSNSRKQTLGITFDGSLYQFGRTFGNTKPKLNVALDDGNYSSIPAQIFEIEDGFFYFLDFPINLSKPVRFKNLSSEDMNSHTIYSINQESRLARRIEEMLYLLGLDESCTLEVKPEILRNLGLEDYKELGKAQLSLEDTFRRMMIYENCTEDGPTEIPIEPIQEKPFRN